MEGVWPKMYGYWFHVSSFCQALAEKISNKGWTNSMRLGGWDVISGIPTGDELMEFGLGNVSDRF